MSRQPYAYQMTAYSMRKSCVVEEVEGCVQMWRWWSRWRDRVDGGVGVGVGGNDVHLV